MTTKFNMGDDVRTQAKHVTLTSRVKELLKDAPNAMCVYGTVLSTEKGSVRVSWNIQGSIFASYINPSLLELTKAAASAAATPKRRKVKKEELSEESSGKEEECESTSEEEEDEPPDDKPLSALLTLGSVTWVEQGREVDPRSKAHWDFSPKVKFPVSQTAARGAHTAYDCVDMLLTDKLFQFVQGNLGDFHVTRDQILVYLALKAYIAHVHKLGHIRDHWSDYVNDPLGLYPRRNLRDFMSRDVFERIDLNAMGPRDSKDLYKSTKKLLALIGEASRDHLVFGLAIAHDESMWWFYGLETDPKAFAKGLFQEGTNPPLDKIKGKPRPLGYWITTQAVRLSPDLPPIVTHMKIRKSPSTNSPRIEALQVQLGPIVGTFGKSCSTVLRATDPHYDSGRIIVFDSLYCGVQSVVALAKLGVFAVGTVAHCRALFPMAALKKLIIGKGRGEMVFLRATVCGVDLLAAAYRTKKLHFLLGSCGTSEAAPDVVKKWYSHETKAYVTLRTPRCDMIWWFHRFMNGVDVHNHLRQYGLALEETFRRTRFERRMWDFGLGVLLTNAFSMWAWETRNFPECDCSSQAFRKSFVYDALIKHTDFGQKTAELPPRQATPPHLRSKHVEVPHFYSSFKQIPSLAADKKSPVGSIQKICAECGKRTSYFCSFCYYADSKHIIHIYEGDAECGMQHELKNAGIVLKKDV